MTMGSAPRIGGRGFSTRCRASFWGNGGNPDPTARPVGACCVSGRVCYRRTDKVRVCLLDPSRSSRAGIRVVHRERSCRRDHLRDRRRVTTRDSPCPPRDTGHSTTAAAGVRRLPRRSAGVGQQRRASSLNAGSGSGQTGKWAMPPEGSGALCERALPGRNHVRRARESP